MDKLARFQNALASDRVPAIAELRARPIMDHAGQPLVVAGNNAFVARLRRSDGRDIALRIVAPGGKGRDWNVRYTALDAFQGQQQSDRLPGSFRIVRQPLRPDDVRALYGATGDVGVGVATEWIQGPTLLQAVDRAASTGNVQVIRALDAAFIRLWNDLHDLEFVHGDLTASNILVRANGHLACVDLDGASWRGAPLAPSGEGSPGYRHPTLHRDADLRDLYAALVIHASLAILAEAPHLREAHGDAVDIPDGVLLFSAWDLAHPQSSRTFDAVSRSVPVSVQSTVNSLISASLGDVDDIIEACASVPGVRMRGQSPGTGAAPLSSWNVAPFLERMRAHYGDTWTNPVADASTSAADAGLAGDDVSEADSWPTWSPPDLPEPASVTTGDIDELKQALAHNDEAEVMRIWAQVSDDPLASLLAAQVEGVLATSYDRRIVEESRQRQDRSVIALGEEAEMRRIPLGPRARTILRQARERVDVQGRLDRALATGNRAELAELAVSGRLVVLGDTDRQSLQRVIQAIEWPVLQRAIESDDDVLIDAAFDDELFGEDATLEADVRERVDLARSRIRWLAEVRAALAQRRDARLRDLFIDPPSGAAERLGVAERRRIRRTIEQYQALHDLHAVIESGDEPGIIAALNRVERVSARISDKGTWAAIQRVVERVSLIDELLEASQENPLDYGRLAQLLPAVKALGIGSDPRLGDSDLVNRLEGELVRMAHVRRIQAAIARDNDIAIVTAAVPDPRNALELLSREERDRVAAAIRARRQAARSLKARGAGAIDPAPRAGD